MACEFVQFIPSKPIAGFFTVVLENYQVQFTISFNLTLQRWMLDAENISLGTFSYGIAMNQGIDLFNASSQLDLQALVLVNTTKVDGLEADTGDNLGTDLVLIYMDLETYSNNVLGNAELERPIYRIGC